MSETARQAAEADILACYTDIQSALRKHNCCIDKYGYKDMEIHVFRVLEGIKHKSDIGGFVELSTGDRYGFDE